MKRIYNKIFSVFASVMMSFSLVSNLQISEIHAEESNVEDASVEVKVNETKELETTNEVDSKVEEMNENTEEQEIKEENENVDEPKLVDVSSLDGIDFSSKRLLVCMNSSPKEDEILSSYNDVYLLQYETEFEAKVAYLQYESIAQFVDVDTTIQVADDVNITGEMSEESNPISELNKEMNSISNRSGMIAVIDTGSTVNGNVLDSCSVVGDDVADMNGHGTKVIGAIVEQNPNVQILSIKAFGANGTATVSSVYAAIQLAIESNVSYINLSLSGVATPENEAVKTAILDAISKGIVVVGAAGNKGSNASYYVPGNVSEALIIGACNEKGIRNADSNYGETVDYNVVGESSSIATARMTGLISKNGKVDVDHKLVFETDYDPSKDDSLVEVLNPDGTTDFVPAGYVVTVTTPHGILLTPDDKWAIGTNANIYGYDVYAPMYIDGKSVYCIQQNVDSVNGAGDYSAKTLGTYLGNAALTAKLELIVALGYGYNGDWSEEMDFATQIRIWQEMGKGTVTNIHSDIQAKINTINSRIAAYNAGVSFSGQTFTFSGYGKENAITVKDSNGALNYSTISASGIHYTKSGNTLTMWLEEGDTNPKLTIDVFGLSTRSGQNSIAYDSGYSQDVAYIQHASGKKVSLKISVQGKVTLKKSSADTAITSGNKCYSLEGTQYGVYTDAKCTKKAGTLTVKADGTTNTLTLSIGTYYVKEIKSGKGYNLDSTVHTVKISAGNTTTVNVKDAPVSDPVLMVVEKKDGSGKRLEGAQFTVEYYSDYYDSVPSVNPTRQWVLKTNEKGQAVLNKDLLVSGDEFYYTPGGDATFPLGTVVIYESKAPEGYTLDGTTKHIMKIGLDQTGKILEYNAPVATDYKVTVSKKDVAGNEIEGAKMQVIDENGKVVDSWISDGTEHLVDNLIEGHSYTIQEAVAAKGYVKATNIPFTAGKKDQHFDVIDKMFSVTKTDEKDNQVIGAKLQVLDKNGIVMDTWITDGSVHYVDNLTVGQTYVLKEIETPKGYITAEEKEFTISKENVNESITMVDEMNATIKIHKKDESGNSLKGVVYSIDYKENKEDEYERFGEYTTDENGEIYIDHLDFGFYRIIEIRTVEGMNLLKDSIEIELPYGDEHNEKCYDAEYEITDSANLIMPTTGASPVGKAFMIAAACVISAFMLMMMEENKKMNR